MTIGNQNKWSTVHINRSNISVGGSDKDRNAEGNKRNANKNIAGSNISMTESIEKWTATSEKEVIIKSGCNDGEKKRKKKCCLIVKRQNIIVLK